tara:strand:- start:35 stop:244 length:210 start_codon:yes stop_codon:yes gene_type:complete
MFYFLSTRIIPQYPTLYIMSTSKIKKRLTGLRRCWVLIVILNKKTDPDRPDQTPIPIIKKIRPDPDAAA